MYPASDDELPAPQKHLRNESPVMTGLEPSTSSQDLVTTGQRPSTSSRDLGASERQV